MRKKLPFILAVLLTSTALAGDSSPSTAQLIEQLGNKDFTKREQASRMLQARGPSVLPALRNALKHRDAEVRRRVGALVPVLEAVAALTPRRITLDAQQQPLADVLKEIEKQSGYKIAAGDVGPKERCTIRLRAVPFWAALEQIGTRTGRAVTVLPLQEGIQLQSRQARPPFVVLHDPFRLEATHFHEDRDIDFAQPGNGKEPGRKDHLLSLTLCILAEPKFVLLSVGKVQVDLALDEQGKPLPAVRSEPPRKPRVLVLEQAFRQDFQHMAKILLRRSSPTTKRIKHLRGSVPVEVMVRRNPVVVTESFLTSKGTKCHLGEAELEITQAEKNDDHYDVRIAVPPEKAGRRTFWHQRIHLEDARGNRYTSSGGGNSTSGNLHEILLHYRKADDPKVGPPSKLIIEDWIILHHSIPFEFKEVPLP